MSVAAPSAGPPTSLAPHHLRLFGLLIDYVAAIVFLKLVDQAALGAQWDLRADPGLFSTQPAAWGIGGLLLLLFRDWPRGRSLGKWLTGIAVRRADNPARVPASAALLLRNLSLAVLPLDALLAFRDPYLRRLGDRIAGTVVVLLPRPAPLGRRMLLFSSLFLGFLLLAFLITPWNMRRTAAFAEAQRIASALPQLRGAVGTPLELGGSPRFELQLMPAGGRAEFTFAAEGPRGEATVNVVLRLGPHRRRWTLETVAVTGGAARVPPLVTPAPAGGAAGAR